MGRRTKLVRAEQAIVRALRNSGVTIYAQKALAEFFYAERSKGTLARHTKLADFLNFMTENGHLRLITLQADHYDKRITRYCLTDPTSFELAASISKSGYLSHGTAAQLHGLLTLNLPTVYLNSEQSVKPNSSGPLTQIAIDRAFGGKQRQSKHSYRHEDISITIINGKNTNRLGVKTLADGNGHVVSTTNLERTLIDIAVRPAYAGGISCVLQAYRSARNRTCVPELVATLDQLGYIYPYAQAIGFLMQQAGFSESECSLLKPKISEFDFYLTHGLKKSEYDSSWRLFYPKGFCT